MNRLLSKTTKPHGTTSSLYKLPFDLNVFKETKTECFKLSSSKSDDIPITERCSRLTRLCAATSYWNHIRDSAQFSEDEKRSLIVEFNENVYRSILDDVAHFVKEHDGDIQRVHSEWTELYGFAKCSVSESAETERHHEEEGGIERGRERVRKRTHYTRFMSHYMTECIIIFLFL